MSLSVIHSYLVHPDKHKVSAAQTEIRGTVVAHSGRLFHMLASVFDAADRECTYDITFDSSSDGSQENECRDLLIGYMRDTSLEKGRQIALRLQSVTTGKSGLGLLFILTGGSRSDRKIVLSRFPADSAILAEEGTDGLSVQFLEKVFMRSATAYKAAVYRGGSLEGDFWDGRAIDKQINNQVLTISNYWIKDFLASDFRATSAQGTKRLATILLAATKSADEIGAKQEIVAAARLASGLSGKSTSIKEFCAKFHLSDAAQAAIRKHLPNESVFTERFRLSSVEFAKHIAIQSVELSNGAILMAPAEQFEKIFDKKILNQNTQETRYSTQGRVVDQRLKRTRP